MTDVIEEQFRRTLHDRKKMESENHTLKLKLQDREEALERLRDELQKSRAESSLAHLTPARTPIVVDDPQANILRQQVPELRAEVEAERQRRKELETMILSEKQRIELQMEEYHTSIGRRLIDTEHERDRLSNLLLQKEQEVLLKDNELREAYKENASIRDNLERVAHDLVERNKRHDEVAAKRYAQYEEEIKRSKADQMRLLAETKELRELLSRARNECAVLATQCDTAQNVNHEAMTDLQSAQGKANTLAKELHEATFTLHQKEELISTLKEENAALLDRIDRIEGTLRTKAEEDIAQAEKYASIRLQFATIEDEVAHEKQVHADFVQKVSHAVGLVHDEVRKVLSEIDASRDSFVQLVRPHEDIGQGPRDEEIPPEPMDPEEMALEFLARSSDTLVVIWEEVHSLKLDTRHELLRREEYHRQVDVLREAYEADHTHISELNGRIQHLTSQLNLADRERASLQETMKDSERWMDEAVRCTDEQKHRNEQMMVEKERLQSEIVYLTKQVEAFRLACHERESEVLSVRSQCEKLSRDNWELQRTRCSVDDESGKLREMVATSRNDTETLTRTLKRAEKDLQDARERCNKAETDVRFLNQQVEDMQRAKTTREKEVEELHKEVRTLRDDLSKQCRILQETQTALQSASHNSATDQALRDHLKEKERQMELLRRQRDDADAKCQKALEDNARLQSRLNRDAAQYTPGKAGGGGAVLERTPRSMTSAERVRELESRVSALLSSKEIDAWRFK